MKIVGFIFPLLVAAQGAIAQLRTINSDGNWNNTAIWNGGLIADTPGEDVDMLNNVDVSILSGENYTIGNLTANNNNSITIAATGSLTLSPGNFLTAGNGTTITVNGTFTINGDFQVNNNVNLVINGTMIVTGNVEMGTNGTLSVNGGLSVQGNFTGSNNTNITVNGSIDIDGNISVGNNSSLSGTGTVSVGGTCTDGNTPFCADSQLPIELLFFNAAARTDGVELTWATASEYNFDYFVVGRSADGEFFEQIARIKGSGNSSIRSDYDFVDHFPQSGKNYYRLTEVDIDGFTKHFNIVAVNHSAKDDLVIWPNPTTTGQVVLDFVRSGGEVVDVVISNAQGQRIYQFTTDQSRIQLEQLLPCGIYQVTAWLNGARVTQRLIVL